MTLRILFIGVSEEWCVGLVEPSTTVKTRYFGSGEIPHLEYEYYQLIAANNVVEMTVNAEHDGFDAVVIGCFDDPGLREAQELVKIPVIGVGQACFQLASMLSAETFSVLVGRKKSIARMAANARIYGLESKIASWRTLGLTVPEMTDPKKTRAAILRESRAAIEKDGAEAVCLGCTALVGQAKDVQAELGVPILDPVLVGLQTAEFRALLWKEFGISHSKNGGYETPPHEELSKIFKYSYGPISKISRRIGAALFTRF